MHMTKDQIKHMVDRFLGWKLPRDTFNPDCGISFDKKPFNTHTPYPSQYEPSGTNLFDATQADAMVRYMVEGMPPGNGTELVTERDMDDARSLGERSGIDLMDDWNEFVHDIAQSIADGRRPDTESADVQ